MTRHIRLHTRAAALLLTAVVSVSSLACSDDEPPPVFEIPGTGGIEGLLFLDTDRDGRYDPSVGDRLLTDVGVRVLARGTTQTIAGGTARTNAAGRFTLAGLPVGSHELAIDTAGVGAGVAFCQNPIPITVFLRETQFQQVAARGGCVITIAEAEAGPTGAPVTIRGVVVSSPGQINATDNRMYVQDNTGGIRVESPNLGGRTVAVGDIVEVAGLRNFISQETAITGGRVVEHQPGGAAPVPEPTTTKAIADSGPLALDPLQGTLVVVRKARVTTIWGNGTGSSRNAFINDDSGVATIRIDLGVVFTATAAEVIPRLSEIMALNKCYDVVGIATSFGGGAQLFPRTLADITEVPCT